MSVKQLMIDAIDLHAHCAPNDIVESRVDAVELAQQATAAGMKGVVLKNQLFGSAPVAWLANKYADSSVLIGALVMNNASGGLNADVVAAQARLGAKVVWLPTISAAEHIRTRSKGKGNPENPDNGIAVIDKDGKLVPEVNRILAVIKKNKMALATGHVSKAEVFAVAPEALKQKINVIITHPFGSANLLTLEEGRELVKLGAYIEFLFAHCMPPMLVSPEKMAGLIKNLGVEHCIIGTDFGQDFNPPPTEGFRMMLSLMLKFGLSEDELTTIVKVNPSKILGMT
jgi:hypothetical protein